MSKKLEFNDYSMQANPLFILMIILFLFIFLIPYLYGWRQAKIARELILEKQNKWLDKSAGVLKSSTSSDLNEKLDDFIKKIGDEKNNFKNKNKIVDSLIEIDPDLDFRTRYVGFLDRLNEQANHCKQQSSDPANNIRNYIEQTQINKKEIAEKLSLEKTTRPQIWVGFISLTTPILAPILNKLFIISGLPLQSLDYAKLISATLAGIP